MGLGCAGAMPQLCMHCMVSPCACRARPPEPMTIARLERLLPLWIADSATASGQESCHAIWGSTRDPGAPEPEGPPLLLLGGNGVTGEWIAQRGVTHILSIVSSKRGQAVAAANDSRFARLSLDIGDDYDADLGAVLPEAFSFIDEAAAAPDGFCYVHCEMGRSRSASVVIAWLMHRQALQGSPPSLIECYAAVASRRRITALNYGFWARLCDLEASLGAAKASLPPISYFLLMQHAGAGFLNPAPDYSELLRESGGDVEDVGATPRQRAVRRAIRSLRFVWNGLADSSGACRQALRDLSPSE